MLDNYNSFPGAFLIGAPKCGTSSMYQYFTQHPDIFVPEIKEPHYFAMPEVGETYYPVELIHDESTYLALFQNKSEKQLSIDCSPSYLQFPKVPKRIYAANSDAKIIAILRNPTQRAISHYLMDQRFGLHPQPLMECIQEPNTHPIAYREYVENGLYAEQIKRYWDTFPTEQVKIILFDDLNKDTRMTVMEIFKFLGIREDVEIDYNKRSNVGGHYRFTWMRHLIHSHVWRMIRSLFSNRLKASIRNKVTKTTSPRADYKEEEKILNKLFKADVLKLEKMLGRSLKHWIKS